MTKKEKFRGLIKSVLFYHVILLLMVNTDEQYKFDVKVNYDEKSKGGPWCNHSNCPNIRGSSFGDYFSLHVRIDMILYVDCMSFITSKEFDLVFFLGLVHS